MNEQKEYTRLFNKKMMKKFMYVLVMLMMMMFAEGKGVMAQYDAKAKKILDAMSTKYQSIPSFSANITYTLENKEDDIYESFEGEIGIKGEKFRLVAIEQEIIINDGNVWTYLVDENEVNIDTFDPEEDDVTPSNIYNLYKSGYKYMLFGEKTIDGENYDIVDMSPEDKESDYFRIRLVISKNNKVLRRFTLFAKSGNHYIYDITEFNSKANLPDSYFVFDINKHKDVEVIDLRIDN